MTVPKQDLIEMYNIVRKMFEGDCPNFDKEILPILTRNGLTVDEDMYVEEEE